MVIPDVGTVIRSGREDLHVFRCWLREAVLSERSVVGRSILYENELNIANRSVQGIMLQCAKRDPDSRN